MTQGSREALIDLLFLSLYLDDHLSIDEDEVLNEALESLGWASPSPRETYIWKAFSKAREASACEGETLALLEKSAAVIKAEGGEGEALTWLTRVLGADGVSSSEKHFLGRLEAILYPES